MPSYEAYLLRIWWSGRREDRWRRCRLERLPGGEQQQFADLRTRVEPEDPALVAPLTSEALREARHEQHDDGERP